MLDDEGGDPFDIRTALQIREEIRTCASHAQRVGSHDREIRADKESQVDLVDANTSERVMLRPPLRGTFSPPATSIT